MIVEKIAEVLGYAADYLKADYILYGAGGLIVLVFILALLPLGYAVKFRKNAEAVSAYLKGGSDSGGLDARMKAFPKPVVAAWNNFQATEGGGGGAAAPAVYLTQSVCVGARIKNGAEYLFLVIITALTAFFLNLLALEDGTAVGADEIAAPLAAIVLGIILWLILRAVGNARHKRAVAAYNELIVCLNARLPEEESSMVFALPEGTTVHPETCPEKEAEEMAEEPVSPPAKAYWEQSAGFAPPPAREGADYANPPKEDVVAQIERITASGASKQTMLDVARLLQAERAKAENKTPEQQRRLNAALATLLRAISAANN